MIVEEGKHYLYRHVRIDKNEPFYVGIGTQNNRMNYQRSKEKDKRSTFWKTIIKKTNYKVEIIMESDDYEFIKEKEIEFIALYGRRDLGKGTLVNLTDGGEGTTGAIRIEVHRGSKCPQTKLTEQQVYEIKFGHKYLKQTEIAKLYGVSRGVITDIRKNRTWKHVVSDLPITTQIKHLCDCLGNY